VPSQKQPIRPIQQVKIISSSLVKILGVKGIGL
jgi:hypothetical protein